MVPSLSQTVERFYSEFITISIKYAKVYAKVEVVIHDRKATHQDGEDTRKLLEPVFDPLLTVKATLAQKKCPANTACNTLIPASDSWIDKLEQAG